MAKKAYTTLALLLLAFCGYGQEAASLWYFGNGYGLRFEKGAATVVKEGPVNAGTTYTISDVTGKLLLYANKLGIFNRQGALMENGNWEDRAIESEIYIIPKPGSPSQYYLFYVKVYNPNSGSVVIDNALVYAVADIAANNGAGKILEKDKIIYRNLHGYFTVSGLCDNSTYWLVGEANANVPTSSDQLLAYRITAAGIAGAPVRSTPVSIGNSSGLKFSPKGDKIIFSYSGNPGFDGIGLSHFSTSTGVVSPSIALDIRGWQAAFSPSGNKLYLSGKADMPEKVWQYDISSGNLPVVLATKTLVYDGPHRFRHMQLAPDGKIYMTQQDNQQALAVINYPERAGAACDVTPNAVLLPEELKDRLPVFAPSLLLANLAAVDAGPDKEVCQGQPLQLGATNDSNYTYYWEPAAYLSDPASLHPTFRYPDAVTEKLELRYILYATDGKCMRADEVIVTVLPAPEKPHITGGRSVCPGVEDVVYSVETQEGYTYSWAVSGGQLVSGQGTAAIRVNWGKSNPAAQVTVTAVNAYGCESELAVLPVRINPVLVPETPRGPVHVCLNQATGNRYNVTYVTGSVYTWGILGGELVSGQGSSQVTVNWQGTGTHKIWIQEQSTTADTVCFGLSDTLEVAVFKDLAALDMDFVTISTEAGDESAQQWQVSNILQPAGDVTVFRRPYGTDTWARVTDLPPAARSHSDTTLPALASYEYKVTTTNSCQEMLESTPHRTILLQGQADEARDEISLNWNAYAGWQQGVAQYELWSKTDAAAEYSLIHKTDGNTLSYSGLTATAGFQHRYRIKAVAAGAAWISWSNSVSFSFEHALFIPNIFTPNGDGYNDTFYIPKLELYPDNELVVYNRWGGEVYRRKGYQGSWNGGNVVTGLYYYQLYVKKLDKYYKGWVEIMK